MPWAHAVCVFMNGEGVHRKGDIGQRNFSYKTIV